MSCGGTKIPAHDSQRYAGVSFVMGTEVWPERHGKSKVKCRPFNTRVRALAQPFDAGVRELRLGKRNGARSYQ